MTRATMQVEEFFDPATSTFSYLVLDADSGACALIDSVLDYDPHSGRTATTSAAKMVARVRELGARVEWQLETHVHADHLSAAPWLQAQLGGQLVIGKQVAQVQETFGKLFNAGSDFARDGSQFDRLLTDGEQLSIGGLTLQALHTPGHTPACMTYVISDGKEQAAFIGDTLFMTDYGTARCDFPGGDARALYRSIQRILSLPDETRLYLCHDYPPSPGARPIRFVTTVAEQRRDNIHLQGELDEERFAAMREARDAELAIPALMIPSVQVNMRGGHLPPPEDNGVRYLKIPLDTL